MSKRCFANEIPTKIFPKCGQIGKWIDKGYEGFIYLFIYYFLLILNRQVNDKNFEGTSKDKYTKDIEFSEWLRFFTMSTMWLFKTYNQWLQTVIEFKKMTS